MGIYGEMERDYGLELSQGRKMTKRWSLPALTNDDFSDVTDVPSPLLLICFTWHGSVATEEQGRLQIGFLAPLDCQKLEEEDTDKT